MLKTFGKLNGAYSHKTESDMETLLNDPKVLTLESFQYDPLPWPARCRRIAERSFKNVGLSKTAFKEITFKNCAFEDCLFIGSVFEEVEFHGCSFKNCNLYKADFRRCYIDPNSFSFDKIYWITESNMGVGLYQALVENSADLRQTEFQIAADIRFKQWKRAQLSYDRKEGKITRFQELRRKFGSYMYEWTSGFGYRPFKFFLVTVALFGMVALGNYIFLRDQISVGVGNRTLSSLADSVFYSFSILTVLGFSSITPVSGVAKIAAVSEALAAIGWLGIYTSLVVKRFIR
jgi:hypothetical protein